MRGLFAVQSGPAVVPGLERGVALVPGVGEVVLQLHDDLRRGEQVAVVEQHPDPRGDLQLVAGVAPVATGGAVRVQHPADEQPDPVSRLDDPDFPALTMSQAAQLLGVQAAFLRSLDSSGVLQPHRSPGGHRRYSRQQLTLAARMRTLLDDGHSLASAETIVGLQDELASARADAERLRSDVARLQGPDLAD